MDDDDLLITFCDLCEGNNTAMAQKSIREFDGKRMLFQYWEGLEEKPGLFKNTCFLFVVCLYFGFGLVSTSLIFCENPAAAES